MSIEPNPPATGTDAPPPPVPVLHLDEHLVVVSKPAGVVVHRSDQTRDEAYPLLQTLSDQLGRFLFPVHRLDRNTSGVIAFGLTKEAAGTLHANLSAPESIKEYLVLVRGETPETFSSERPLSSERKVKQEARTDFTRLATFSRCSLLRARIHTGRRHQIRRHLAHLAHQVIGDVGYGKGRINQFFRDTYGLPRMFVHAERLRVAHPAGGVLEIVAPLADDLVAFLDRLPDAPAVASFARRAPGDA